MGEPEEQPNEEAKNENLEDAEDSKAEERPLGVKVSNYNNQRKNRVK
jgi:hypothetical protein